MKYSVIRVNSPGTMQAFLKLPELIYGEGKVPPTAGATMNLTRYMPMANPALRHIRFVNFVAMENGRPVGRITASYDLLNPRPEEGFWGGFECVRRPEVARSLLEAAARWLKEQGKAVMIGPATLNTNQQVGLLIKGFEYEPQVEIPYNPPYYRELVEEAGMEKLHELECFEWHLPDNLPEKLRDAKLPPGLNVRAINYGAAAREAGIVAEIYNRSMSGVWGFIPITVEEAAAFITTLSSVVPPDFFVIFEMQGKPTGLFLSIPTRPPVPGSGGGMIRLAIGGIVPEYRSRGIPLYVLKEFYIRCKESGYTRGEASQVAESNDVVKRKIIKPLFGGKVIKLYRVYRFLLEK